MCRSNVSSSVFPKQHILPRTTINRNINQLLAPQLSLLLMLMLLNHRQAVMVSIFLNLASATNLVSFQKLTNGDTFLSASTPNQLPPLKCICHYLHLSGSRHQQEYRMATWMIDLLLHKFCQLNGQIICATLHGPRLPLGWPGIHNGDNVI